MPQIEQIAIISDIHGNMPAFEAVENDIRSRGIRRVICLGDLVGKGPQPVEVIQKTQQLCEAVVQGNWDLGISYPQEKEAGLWQQKKLSREHLQYLVNLPFSVELQLSGNNIRLFHASAKSVFHRVPRKASKEEKLAMFENTEESNTPNIIGYGDIHTSYMQTLKKDGVGLRLFNVGSVGQPYDGIPQASYCILEGAPGLEPAPFSIRFIRVPYSIELALDIARSERLPNLERYIYELSTGLEQKK